MILLNLSRFKCSTDTVAEITCNYSNLLNYFNYLFKYFEQSNELANENMLNLDTFNLIKTRLEDLGNLNKIQTNLEQFFIKNA